MRNTTKKKTAPIICAAAVILVLTVYLAVILYAMLSEKMTPVPVYLILGVYFLGIAAVAVGVLAALRQRLKEIEGGEEDDAKQY